VENHLAGKQVGEGASLRLDARRILAKKEWWSKKNCSRKNLPLAAGRK
jgi:hypothetical protein